MIYKLVKKLLKREVGLDLNNPEHLKVIKKAYGSYYVFRNIYEKMYEYYKGNTDAIKNYLFVTERSNLKINANYIKKFIKEEVAYAIGNDITYESVLGNDSEINDINYNMKHWDEKHDMELMKYMLIFTTAYELYYIDDKNQFSSKIIKPTEGYAYYDKASKKILFFIHAYKNDFDRTISYVDVYTDSFIYHFDSKFNQIAKPTPNLFGEVPVSIAEISEEKWDDSLYKDLKGVQDAFETNLSDVANEISDFRNAYLLFKNCDIEEENVKKMKKLGVLQLPGDNADAEWLIKNINDSFMQNTLDRYQDLMYQLACHINHNEKLVSNVSGVALDSKLIVLKYKCIVNTKSHYNVVKNRIRFMFIYLKVLRKDYDWKDVNAIYTSCIPADDLRTAQMVAQLPEDFISDDTLRGLFSFITNKVNESKKVKEQKKNKEPEVNLDFAAGEE